jgi:predicted SAM-dependent methyltransferase
LPGEGFYKVQSGLTRRESFDNYVRGLRFWNLLTYRITLEEITWIRSYFADKYLVGDGLEIGAQANPLIITNDRTRVKYVDRLSDAQSHIHYIPDTQGVVKVDLVCEADNLVEVPSQTIDFVIANHVLEHTEDPIGVLLEWLRVLKHNGLIYLVVPNFVSNEFDFERKPVPLDHLIRDNRNSLGDRKSEHWQEFISKVEEITKGTESFSERFQHYQLTDLRIHMHVFSAQLITEVIEYIGKELGIQVVELDTFHLPHCFEIISIIQKTNTVSQSSRKRLRLLRNILIVVYLVVRRKLAWLFTWVQQINKGSRILLRQGPSALWHEMAAFWSWRRR